MLETKKKVGLFGFGTVGQGFYQLIDEKSPFEIVKICVKDKNKPRPLPLDKFTYSIDEILNDDSITIVVELISDAKVAFDIVECSLKKGKSVISANKSMISCKLSTLIALQSTYNARLFYEASVCGSIPIIQLLDAYYSNDTIHELSTICNGTSNYILTKIASGKSFSQALTEAQSHGFAELDPSSDIQGLDSKYKLVILIAYSFGLIVDPGNIFCYGIEKITKDDSDFAIENGHCIKLIAYAAKTITNEINAYVIPKLIPQTHLFNLVNDEYNAVEITAKYINQQFLVGKGAGAYPTSIAVLSDLNLVEKNRFPCYNLSASNSIFSNNTSIKIYLRCSSQSTLNSLKNYKIINQFQKNNLIFFILEISLSDLITSKIENDENAFIMVF